MGRLLYFICTTNRTGASWLCAMLRSTGVAGRVREIIHKRHPQREWRDNLASNPYGIKLNPAMMRRIWPLVTPEEKQTAKFIWLVRHDSWRQAISQYRANRSHVWHVGRGKSIPEDHLAVPFDTPRITEIREGFLQQNHMWPQWFEENGVRPLKIAYERLCFRAEMHVRRILGHLGLTCDGPIDTGTHQVLRDEITDAWVQRLTAGNDSDSSLIERAHGGSSQQS